MEFFRGISDLSDVISRINRAGEEILDANHTFDNSGFLSDIRTLQLDESPFSIEGGVGDYRVTYEGRVVDLEGVKSSMGKGDLIEGLKKLGIPDSELSSVEVKKYSEYYEKAWNNQPGLRSIRDESEMAQKGNKISQQVGEPSSALVLEQILKDNSDLKNYFSDGMAELKKKIKESGGSGRVEVGKWIKRTIILSLTGVTVAALFQAISAHQKAMNGCWLVNLISGEKCKVKTMTCFSDPERECSNDVEKCGSRGVDACFGPDLCVQFSNGLCTGRLGQCGSGVCHPLCDNSKITVPLGYQLTCVNVSWWTASMDFFESVWSGAKWWLWVLCGVVVVVLLLILFLR
jgi:hypothetical protein